jgi:GT2 family glycosyltransferase
VNFNSLEDTIECLQSILECDGDLPYVVVVDNGSNNQKEIESKLSFYPKLKVILNPINIGFGRANNLGIDWLFNNLKSEYVFILNNDTLVGKESLNILIDACLDSSNEVALVAPKILVKDNVNEVWYEGAIINFDRVTPSRTFNNVKSFTEFASGCCMFFKYESLKELGGFDPYFFMYDEDVELSLRLRKLGWKILYVPDAVVYHKCQGSQTKDKNIPSNQLHPNHPSLNFYLKNTILNRKYIIEKHLRGVLKLRSKLNHTFYWLLKSIQYVLYGKLKSSALVVKYLLK